MGTLERVRPSFLRVAGYLVLLFQSLPPCGVWTGLMTVPLISYLVMVVSSLPVSLPSAFYAFFLSSELFLERVTILVGLSILVYSTVYLRAKRKEGLVTSGPYGLVRHPQYLGTILLTLGLTSWSYWILTHTFGIGFLSPSMTRDVWFLELFAYVLLAQIEELYLSRTYQEPFENYRKKVPFLIPLLRTDRRYLDVLISILVPALLLLLLIGIQV